MADNTFDIPAAWNLSNEVRSYIAQIDPKQWPAFRRIMRLVFEIHPDASAVISYQMPTFINASCHLHVGVWKNWVSLYGWSSGRDGGFAERHPELVTGRGTLQLKPAAAAGIPDEEFRALIEAALTPAEE